MLCKTTKILLFLHIFSKFANGVNVMAKRSLQNDNKIKKTKKSSFFDVDEPVLDGAEPQSKVVETEEKPKEASETNRRFKLKVSVFASVLAVLIIAAAVISGMDFIINNTYNDDGVPEAEETPGIVFEIYEPNWEETDIYADPDYVVLFPDRIEYSDDGGLSYKKADREDIERVGGNKLVFLNKYFDAVKMGDHEAVNAMLTEAYIEKNGKYEDFPMQKVFNIKITRKNYNDPAYDNAEYDDYYFVVSYNIYRNDGMFRADCDDQYYCKTLMRVLINSEGDGKIDLVQNYTGE